MLAETIPPNFTPRSKWYHAETIWFREQIAKRGIKLVKCPTIDQLGDIFTKGLPRATFEHLRKKLCGWSVDDWKCYNNGDTRYCAVLDTGLRRQNSMYSRVCRILPSAS